MSLLSFKDELHEAIQDLLWRQWSQLGVAGYVEEKESAMVLDPEALLLFSSRWCQRDDRLYDVMVQWLSVRGGLINVSRLKALQKQSAWKAPSLLGKMAAEPALQDDKRWRRIAEEWCDASRGEMQEPTLLAAEGKAPFSTRKISRRLPQQAATALLRLRAMVGVSARAEVLLLLMLSPYCPATELSARSGYSRSALHELLKEMVQGEAIEQETETPRGICLLLRESALWRTLLHLPETTEFPHWQHLYDALGLLWETVANPRLAALSEQTQEAEWTRVYKNSVRRHFMLSRLPSLLSDAGTPSPAELGRALQSL